MKLNNGDLGVILSASEQFDTLVKNNSARQMKIYFFKSFDNDGNIRYIFNEEIRKVSK